MKNQTCSLFNLLRFLLILTCLSSCVYSKVVFPLDEDVNVTSLGSKVGRASNHSILWLVAWGDAGTAAAAKDADITVIKHMDMEQYVILFGLYTKYTTIAYGD